MKKFACACAIVEAEEQQIKACMLRHSHAAWHSAKQSRLRQIKSHAATSEESIGQACVCA